MLELIQDIRRNHGLEHATMHLLAQRNPFARLVGRSGPSGFSIYGSVSTQDVASAASEAILRLGRGESHLAVHPRCGTNLVVTACLAGLAAFAVGGGERRARLERLPLAVMVATLAAVAAQPLAQAIQERVTTSPDAGGATISGITRQEQGRLVVHRVAVVGEGR